MPLRLYLISFIAALILCFSSLRASPARNPYLTHSAWPITHYDAFASQASNITAINNAEDGVVDFLFGSEVAGTLTVLYTADNSTIWGSSLASIFKVDRSGPRLKLIDYIPKDAQLRSTDVFRGIYCVLSKDDIFYASVGNVISAYTNEIAGNHKSRILPIGQFIFDYAEPSENILSIVMTYDGYLVFTTSRGRVGVVDRNLKHLVSIAYPIRPGEKVYVTNSTPLDEAGGIYMVSSRYMHRLFWDGKKLHGISPNHNGTASFQCACDDCQINKCQIWTTPYDVDETSIVGRPTQYGSGTTPTLFHQNGALYCTIADGSLRQKVVVFETATGVIVAQAPVDFGTSEESYTEQSIVVHDGRLLVVQNALTPLAKAVNKLTSALGAQEFVKRAGAPDFVVDNVNLLPVVLGDSPIGYQQFRFDPEATEKKLATTWINKSTGCPNSIPVMSVSSDLVYCLGKTTMQSNAYSARAMLGVWAISALSWQTGELKFVKRTGQGVRFNSLYAAVQVGAEGEIIHGAIGGIVRLKKGRTILGSAVDIAAKVASPWTSNLTPRS